MKKIILLLLIALWIPTYAIINCDIPGSGKVISINVTFNDPDGDCISNDWVALYTYADGSWAVIASDADSTPVDFGTWGCCTLV